MDKHKIPNRLLEMMMTGRRQADHTHDGQTKLKEMQR
jgi:hypothetical protein